MADPCPFPLFKLPTGLLDRVVGCLELWDLAAARAACQTLRAAAGRRATRLVFSPASLQCERGAPDEYVQVRLCAEGRGGGEGRRSRHTTLSDCRALEAQHLTQQTCHSPASHCN
jgi:hypothetical protein